MKILASAETSVYEEPNPPFKFATSLTSLLCLPYSIFWLNKLLKAQTNSHMKSAVQESKREKKNKAPAWEWDNIPGLVVGWNDKKEKRLWLLVGWHQWKHASGAPTDYWMVQTQQRGKLLSICLCLTVCLTDAHSVSLFVSWLGQ